MEEVTSKHRYLFGGTEKWNPHDWTSSDDRVRGGKSQSYLSISPDSKTARFNGTLDISALGGAGFASQRTTGEDRVWHLSLYDGVEIVIYSSDSKRYTFTIKDTLLPPDPDTGREQSTISYEYDFVVPSNATVNGEKVRLCIPWGEFRATYRGREKSDAPELQRGSVKRFGVMSRSFFGEQEGDFTLGVESISARVDEAREVGFFKAPTEVAGFVGKEEEMENGKVDHLRRNEKSAEDVPLRTLQTSNRLPWVMLGLLIVTIVCKCIFRTGSSDDIRDLSLLST